MGIVAERVDDADQGLALREQRLGGILYGVTGIY
jgi:hypothetical protein